MDLTPGPAALPCDTAECGVCAFGVVRVSLDGVGALRKAPGPPPRAALPASLLKHADEQTVAGVAAVAGAMHNFGLRDRSFADWSVLGALRFAGRLCVAEAIQNFLREGPLGMSPHIVPQRSTHSLSGTVSLAFQMRGMNYGVGGGEGALVEGLLAGVAMASEGRLPGLWLVLTEWDPEPVPGGPGPAASEAVCHAVALALVPAPADGSRLHLRLVSSSSSGSAALPTVSSLADFLTGLAGPDSRRRWRCPLEWGTALELTQGISVGVEP